MKLKEELRIRLKAKITAMPDDYIALSDRGLARNVVSLDEFAAARNIFLYFSVEREPDTREIAKIALQMGKTVAFPLCFRGGLMSARVVKDLNELHPAMLGIPAPPIDAPAIGPDDLDLIIVPALAYDEEGYRIGYGGGYYDRYLSGFQAHTVGLARERLMEVALPREPHDVAVERVVTEERSISSAWRGSARSVGRQPKVSPEL